MAWTRPDRETYVRNESEAQRLDRNYAELLQEVRVAQAGVQIFFAFLLTIPFQNRFAQLSQEQKNWYLTTLLCAGAAVVLFVAPVAAHRILFRRRLKDELVLFTGRLAAAGLCFLALSFLGALGLAVDVVNGRLPAVLAVAVGAAVILTVWWLWPTHGVRRRHTVPVTPVPEPDGTDGTSPRDLG
ncbi:DUF6328 family protein [Nakamurella endophytica]|uniref:Membrane protein n=1 Tax=Nakamurella endophytica TaxID=1748367 RepID=A0A917SML1_9ACTN|nr:DUF6328 family protein [Nakamurella endophytica]GGL89386.1 membrane protein [Nakamurella endophytica]